MQYQKPLVNFILELSGLDYVTFRLANVIGPRNVAGSFTNFSETKGWENAFVTESRRDFVFVKDLANVALKACDGAGKGAYHFSSGKDVAIKDLYDEVVKAMGFKSLSRSRDKKLGPDDVFSILLDPKRTFEDFGNIKFTDLSTTVSEAIDYFKQHGTLGEYTHLKIDKKVKMKILITGGVGCLGSNLIEHWENNKYEICVVDNFVTSEKEINSLR